MLDQNEAMLTLYQNPVTAMSHTVRGYGCFIASLMVCGRVVRVLKITQPKLQKYSEKTLLLLLKPS